MSAKIPLSDGESNGRGLGFWLLMWWYTKPDYGFGKQTARLASVGRRGLAKLIDLGLILCSTVLLGWSLSRNFDRDSLAEAIELTVMHSSVQAVVRVAMILGLWMAVAVLSMIAMQGWWGVTPGKWCCRLRTLRTTLRPCGFARSLVREFALCIDGCSFVCWTPGVLSIALTDHRQRIGDRAADTIVVEV